jgi:hypothetical protein
VTSHPEFVQRRKHIDRKPVPQVAQPQTSFWPRWGEGEGIPGSPAGHPTWYPHRRARAPGPKTGRGPLHRPYSTLAAESPASTACRVAVAAASARAVRSSWARHLTPLGTAPPGSARGPPRGSLRRFRAAAHPKSGRSVGSWPREDTEIVCFAGTRSSVVCAKIPR